ncbi:MAG: right-handed parallel beta-helix repeat-containing protein [Clostridiales bacterium]|nr:right-handed parallel beta-helix repeat-containing protein [Clostridiales bacterium]
MMGYDKGRCFYIDDRNGNDFNIGLSKEQAWKSLNNVNSYTFLPGDIIRFRSGGAWYGMLAPKGSGEKYNPIIMESYGDGNKPVINGEGTYAALLLKGISYWIVQGLSFTNHSNERTIRQGICICGSATGITQGILIESCEISNVTGENRRNLGVYRNMYWNSGIYITMDGRSSSTNHLHDIIISNNYVHDVLTSGIRVNQQEDFINDIHHTHVVIRNNLIERTGSDGIIVANSISPLIDGNRCLDAGALGTLEDTHLIAGIWVCATENALIQYNEVARTRLFENDGTAFDTDWGTSGDTIFQYNYSHDNQGGFWLDCMGLNYNKNCSSTILRYNISIDDKRCLVQDDQKIVAEFYGNLFVNNKSALQICCHKDGESHYFHENIFAFKESPVKGWQSSHFNGNWYGNMKNLPYDPLAIRKLPFSIEDVSPKDGMEWCGSVWGKLCNLTKPVQNSQRTI